MGEVYLALDETLGARRVALKLLRFDDEETRKRFEQEARAAAHLQHRNIVTVYEYGEHDGRPYIAMELVAGATLSGIIAERRPLSLATRLELIEQACAGLAHAHGQGIVHRDVKPSNLIVDQDGCVKILDFGIAQVPAANLTRGAALMGTPSYMSPEQINGDVIDRRSDVFSLGLVLYELLAYRQAFEGESARVLDRIRFDPPPPLVLAPDGELPDEVATIIQRAVEKRPQKRYHNLLDMRTDIAHARGGQAATWSSGSATTMVIRRPRPAGAPSRHDETPAEAPVGVDRPPRAGAHLAQTDTNRGALLSAVPSSSERTEDEDDTRPVALADRRPFGVVSMGAGETPRGISRWSARLARLVSLGRRQMLGP